MVVCNRTEEKTTSVKWSNRHRARRAAGKRQTRDRFAYLEGPLFELFGENPEEFEVLLFRPLGHVEAAREGRLHKVVREQFPDFGEAEDVDEVEEVEHRLQLGRGGFGDFERGRHRASFSLETK